MLQDYMSAANVATIMTIVMCVVCVAMSLWFVRQTSAVIRQLTHTIEQQNKSLLIFSSERLAAAVPEGTDPRLPAAILQHSRTSVREAAQEAPSRPAATKQRGGVTVSRGGLV